MRIVAGQYRGQKLAAPKLPVVRPTTDRVREAIFNVLAGRFAENCQNASVLDLYAGTGALGLEALSRGAACCLFVEQHRHVCGEIDKNIARFGVADRARVICKNIKTLTSGAYWAYRKESAFNLIFCDPPYTDDLDHCVAKPWQELVAGECIAEGAVFVLERSRHEDSFSISTARRRSGKNAVPVSPIVSTSPTSPASSISSTSRYTLLPELDIAGVSGQLTKIYGNTAVHFFQYLRQ